MVDISQFSNDEIALAGCVIALLVCGTIMSLSYYVGRWVHGSEDTTAEGTARTLPIPKRDESSPRSRKAA